MHFNVTLRSLVVLAFAATLAPLPVTAQEQVGQYGRGMVHDEEGGWRLPTPAEALEAVRLRETDQVELIVPMLRQVYQRRTVAEVDALADSLVAMMLADESELGKLREYGYAALRMAGAPARAGDAGTPYTGAVDAVVRVYETRARWALEAGGDDPFREIFRRFQIGESQRWEVRALSDALGDVLLMEDSAYRGPDYVLALFEGSDPPDANRSRIDPADRGSMWCEAGFLLYVVSPTLPDVRDAGWRARVPDRQRDHGRLCSGPLVR